jgi:hypothetical protein
VRSHCSQLAILRPNNRAGWYDKEQAPARINLPKYLTGARYKAVDNQSPSYVTLFDIASAAAANDSDALALHNPGDRSRLESIESLARNVYDPISVHGDKNLAPGKGKFILVVLVDPEPGEHEDNFNRWYEEEHMGLFAKIPGWLRGRRFVLNQAETKFAFGAAKDKTPRKYIAVHDFASPEYGESAEMKAAMSTEWFGNVMQHVTGADIRNFSLETVYEKKA